MSFGRLNPGDVIGGKYEIERILGTGGMGIVVAARHLDLGQRVAIKFMLRETLNDPGNAERFLREAKTAVKLRSVHTARVLDVTRLADGEPFMVMEYLEGRDLDAELDANGPLPPRVAVDWILQASEALAEAHGLGMIHRDVKLKNMFLTQTVDGAPLVKVLDFGLAKLLDREEDVSLTAKNEIFGSPRYMSPEQMRSAKDADFRSDIWSIGVCLYELLTGRVPFEAATVADTCAMVLKDAVPLPSTFVALPADLEAVVLRCLEKDPARRFQTIADLACALQNHVDDVASVRRILRVTRSAQLSHATTIHEFPPPPPQDASRRTLSAWDFGTPPVGTPVVSLGLATQAQKIAGGIGLGLLLAAVVTTFLVLVYQRSVHAPNDLAAQPAPTFVPMDAPPAPSPAESISASPVPVESAAIAARLPAPSAGAEASTTHPTKRKGRPSSKLLLPNPYITAAPSTRPPTRKNAGGQEPGADTM